MVLGVTDAAFEQALANYIQILQAMKLQATVGDDIDATITDHAGDIFNALGDRESARKYWEQAMSLTGDVDYDVIERKIAGSR